MSQPEPKGTRTLRDVRHLEGHEFARVPSRYCEVEGCGWATQHAKPWCRRHAHLASPYVLAMKPPESKPGECWCGRKTRRRSRYCQPQCMKNASALRAAAKARAS